MGRFWRHVTSDSQLRWIGPDKGAIHLATGAVVNAAWDLWAKAEGKPVTAIAYDVGYESPSSFTAMFHRVLGVPPTHYSRAKS